MVDARALVGFWRWCYALIALGNIVGHSNTPTLLERCSLNIPEEISHDHGCVYLDLQLNQHRVSFDSVTIIITAMINSS